MKNNTIRHCGKILRINDREQPYFYVSTFAEDGFYPCIILEPVGVCQVRIETVGESPKENPKENPKECIVGLDVIFDSEEEAQQKHKDLLKDQLEKLKRQLEEVDDPKKLFILYAQAVQNKDMDCQRLIRAKVKSICEEHGITY